MADATMSCEQCGAEIYPEHIAKKRAGRVGGKLLCPLCVSEKIREMQSAKAGDAGGSRSGVIAAPVAKTAGASGVIRPAGTGGASGVVTPPAPARDETDEPLSLVSEGDGKSEAAPQTLRAFVKTSLAQEDRHEKFTRDMVHAEMGATRCRTFHSKLTDAALSYLDNQINEWIDAHPTVHVKFATSTIGMMEAKQHQEPHVILTVFY